MIEFLKFKNQTAIKIYPYNSVTMYFTDQFQVVYNKNLNKIENG